MGFAILHPQDSPQLSHFVHFIRENLCFSATYLWVIESFTGRIPPYVALEFSRYAFGNTRFAAHLTLVEPSIE
jgi:hypothetical protein